MVSEIVAVESITVESMRRVSHCLQFFLEVSASLTAACVDCLPLVAVEYNRGLLHTEARNSVEFLSMMAFSQRRGYLVK